MPTASMHKPIVVAELSLILGNVATAKPAAEMIIPIHSFFLIDLFKNIFERMATTKGLTATNRLKMPAETVFNAQNDNPKYIVEFKNPKMINGIHSPCLGTGIFRVNKQKKIKSRIPAEINRMVANVKGGAEVRPNFIAIAADDQRKRNRNRSIIDNPLYTKHTNELPDTRLY